MAQALQGESMPQQRQRTEGERLAVAESQINGLGVAVEKTNETLESILETINEIKGDMARSKGFFAGMSFAYASLGMLVGAGIEYLLHK